ncbi:3-isopropylmalate dehydratase [Blyttiomyces sp. JEL0837]|nr:3-isopropylmalate dehydratase [Blyttiomyces sp. JEL0837]
MIIPKQVLKTIKRTGLGTALFHEVRYDPVTGAEIPSFVLNKEPYRSANILIVSGPNFGCGSSREHAPWALLDFGIRCIIAESFADIFFNNCFKNMMLPVVLKKEEIDRLMVSAKAGKEIEIDLERQVVVAVESGESFKFEVEEFRKHCLLGGLDDIGMTLAKEAKIKAFEERRSVVWSWLDGVGYAGKKVVAVPVGGNKKKGGVNDW